MEMMSNKPYTTKHELISIFLLLLFFFLSPPHVTAQQPSPGQYPYQPQQFTPAMAIIIVILIAALFFVAFFSIYIRHCSNSQDTISGTVRPLTTRRVARGLDPSVIEKFPTFNYAVVKEHKIGKGALECAVCLNEFEDDETLRLIPKCDHVFHPECIDEWLASHTTCPVCRADLVPQPGESLLPQLTELTHESQDPEAQSMNSSNNNNTMEQESVNVNGNNVCVDVEAPEVLNVNQTLNRNRTRGSRSGRPPKFPRSHSTGHDSLVQPGENIDRFTLRLPVEVRKQVMNQRLNRTISMVVLPREGSSRRGYRTGGEGSSRGKNSRWLERLDQVVKSDRWVFSKALSFISRSSSVRSPKVAANTGEGISVRSGGPGGSSGDSNRPPV